MQKLALVIGGKSHNILYVSQYSIKTVTHPEVVERLVLLVYEICEADGAVGDEGVGRDGGVVPHRQPHHLGLPQQVRRERLVPCRILNERREGASFIPMRLKLLL